MTSRRTTPPPAHLMVPTLQASIIGFELGGKTSIDAIVMDTTVPQVIVTARPSVPDDGWNVLRSEVVDGANDARLFIGLNGDDQPDRCHRPLESLPPPL